MLSSNQAVSTATPPFKNIIPVLEVSAIAEPPPSKIELSLAAEISILSIPAAGGLSIFRLKRIVCSPPSSGLSSGLLIPLIATELTFPPFWVKLMEKSFCSNGSCWLHGWE